MTSFFDLSVLLEVENALKQKASNGNMVRLIPSNKYAVLTFDGSIVTQSPGDSIDFMCICEQDFLTDTCDAMYNEVTGHFGCRTYQCEECAGQFVNTGQNEVISGVLVETQTDGTHVFPGTTAHGPITDPVFWNNAGFAANAEAEAGELRQTLGTDLPQYQNELVWAPYRVQDNKKALVKVPLSTLPAGSFYLHGGEDAQIKCDSHSCPANSDGSYPTCNEIVYDNTWYVCQGCTSGCVIQVRY